MSVLSFTKRDIKRQAFEDWVNNRFPKPSMGTAFELMDIQRLADMWVAWCAALDEYESPHCPACHEALST